jgi:hypothetical protein
VRCGSMSCPGDCTDNKDGDSGEDKQGGEIGTRKEMGTQDG